MKRKKYKKTIERYSRYIIPIQKKLTARFRKKRGQYVKEMIGAEYAQYTRHLKTFKKLTNLLQKKVGWKEILINDVGCGVFSDIPSKHLAEYKKFYSIEPYELYQYGKKAGKEVKVNAYSFRKPFVELLNKRKYISPTIRKKISETEARKMSILDC